MRILVVTPTYLPIIGGAETGIFEVYRRLARRHQVQILTPRLSTHDLALQSSDDPFYSEDLLPVTRFHDLITFGKGRYKTLWTRYIAPVSLSFVTAVLREVQKFKPDAVNFHYLFPAAKAILALRRKSAVPILLSLVSRADVFGDSNPLFRHHGSLMNKACRSATRITALTNFMIAEYPAREQVSLIPYGADCNRFSPDVNGSRVRSLLGIDQGTFLLFSLQRLTELKRIDLLIHALKQLRSAGHNVKLLLGGRGPEEANLKSLATKLNVAEDVIFCGFIPEHELPGYLAASNVFIFASQSETFGIVLAQALASGKPVVAFENGCISEVIRPEREGLLVPPEDLGALTAGVVELIQNRSKGVLLGLNARRRALEKYNWDHVAVSYEQILTEMCSKAAGPAVRF